MHHVRDLLEELLAVAVRGVRAVLALDAPDAGEIGIDVIQLVHDGVELGDPRLGARIELLFARSIERLIAEARQRERDHVFDVAACRS